MRGKKRPVRRGAVTRKAKVDGDRVRRRPSVPTNGSRPDPLERRLAEALEQQAATNEILRVISSSPTDAQPVFDAIVGSAARLCDAEFSAVSRSDGALLHLVAINNLSPAEAAAFHGLFPRPPERGFAMGRAFLDGQAAHIEDVLADPGYDRQRQGPLLRASKLRAFLAVPILRDGVPIGVIGCARRKAKPFSPAQIALVKSFADQAVIAIENVRLFKELEARNRDLAATLEQQTATSDILRIISSSPTGIEPTFDAIARSATALCDADTAGVFRFDGELVHFVAQHGRTPEEIEVTRRAFPQPPRHHSPAGRGILAGAVIQIADVSQDPEVERAARIHGTVLSVPLIRDGRPLGVITLARRAVLPFTDKQIDLVKTFADQAVIAIENVRLFQELEVRNRDLTETLEQQTATGEILRVIASSPTDAQPVFDTIAESAARLCEAFDVVVMRRDGDRARLVAHHGPIPAGIPGEFSLPLDRGTVAGRSILDGQMLHVADLQAEVDEYPLSVEHARRFGFRAILSAPLMQRGVAIGAIHLRRIEAQLFTDRQVALLKTFADQAVIAIENVRLFTELDARNRALTESLEQRTATGEILRVISSSPTDVQPVFDAIAAAATTLCASENAGVFLFDGALIHFAAHHNWTPTDLEAIRQSFPRIPGSDSVTARAILTRTVAHSPDISRDPEYNVSDLVAAGFRAVLSVPMLRDGEPIGAINVTRRHPTPFTGTQIALLETFAQQAVIAIQNVRLFKELEERNRDLTETLEQQTATSEILRVISSSPTDVQPVFDTIVQNAVRLCDGLFGSVAMVEDGLIHIKAVHNYTSEVLAALRRIFPMPPHRKQLLGRAILTRSVAHVPDVREDSEYAPEVARLQVWRGGLAVPMIRDGLPVGAIFVARAQVGFFSDRQVNLLKTFADQAVIAVENVRLFNELDVRNHDLTETLEQQTATGEILRVISSSPTDVHPVFDTIVENARGLCEADSAAVFMYDGEMVRIESLNNISSEQAGALRQAYPMPANRGHATGRAILTGRPVHIPDVREDPDYALDALRDTVGLRTLLAVPLIRDGIPIGTITVQRWVTPRPFSDKQVALLETFADQAVIAIENVRLFKELEARNRDLTETLEQQTATSEILRAISRSPTDVQPVFDIIGERAEKLCDAAISVVSRFDGELLHMVSLHGVAPEGVKAVQDAFPMRPDDETMSARAVRTRAVVHVPDVLSDRQYAEKGVGAARASGYRGCLAVPMVRDSQVIGAIFVARTAPGPFTEAQVELLKTFADQAVIAVQNVRLFQELEARNHDLTETLEQQTATSEILRVISSSPTDVQPVFDSIAQSAKRLCEAQFCQLYRFDGKLLHFVAHHGLSPEGAEAVRLAYPMAPGRGSAAARSIVSGAIEHIADVHADPDYGQGSVARAVNFRSIVAVPMMRDGLPIGSIAVARTETGLFPDRKVDLLKTFADQAVIAVQNVHLFQELEARTQDLTRSVGELQALGEVSQAVSSTLDLETVLATIVSRAVQLSGSHSGIVYEFDEATQSFHARATHQVTAEHLEALRAAPIRLGEGAVGHAGVVREPVQIADIEDDRQLVAPQAREHLIRQGMRSLLAMPLIREDRLLGGIVIIRREVGVFSPEVVATLQTFASQSVLAFQNARLFREIQRQKQYADALVETSPVAITTVDVRGTVVGWNPGAVRLFGYTEGEAIGRNVDDLVATPETREEVRTNVRRILGGERIHAIGRRARKDGTLVDVEMSSMPLVVDGAEVGFIATYHDITELLRARREAEAANEAKGAFLATMSHEIRTPMNAVIGMSGLLLNTPLNNEQREYAEIVRQSGDTLLTVINDILDFSKIEAGRLELESQPFDVRECVESALDLVASRAAEKGLDLAYVLGDGTPAAIVGDVTRLRQVLLNLLSNAVKFTERGEVVLSVSGRRLKGAAGLHELTFSVRDTGIGIPADRLGRLFQSFSQVDASTTRRYGGTGLGLAISQRLTELMSGRITVTSEVGVGSNFRFTIRAAPATVPIPTRRDLTGVQPSLQGKRVLVVDDNATNRRILTSHLEAWGMLTRATESPVEGLGWIREGERFDIGILDMHMPEMDGVTLAKAVREQPAGASLPLILFTSLGRREARAEEAGFAAYLNKPIKPSQLFDALVSVLAEQPVHVPQRRVERSELDPEMAGRHPLRILLAEDNVVNQKVAIRLLGQMGYRADVAANGLEAIEAVERQTYDVVLMDVQMPELDGFEASREINRRWPGKRPRIVAMTANAMEGDRELCVAAGMDDYVAKPIRVEELVAALGRCQPRGSAGARRDAAPNVGVTTASAAGVIDRAVIERLTATMGRAFAAELIDTFIDDARQLVAALRKALTATDRDAFRRAAHSLKSTSESLGAFGLATLARELETVGQTGRLHEVGDRLERLTTQSELVTRALGEIRHGLAE